MQIPRWDLVPRFFGNGDAGVVANAVANNMR